MGKPNAAVTKKPGGMAKLDFQRQKRSFYKYKKLLRKEGIGPVEKNAIDKMEKETCGEPGNKSKKERVRNTNKILQTYAKVRSKKEVKEEALKKQQERNKIRQEKIKTKKMRHMKLNKLTKKGQPVMKNKMEFMLEKIVHDQETYVA